MSDETPNVTVIPPVALTLVGDFAQKGLTVLATTAAAGGWIAPGHVSQAVSFGVSAALFAASCAWTYVAAKIRDSRLRAAVAAPASIPVTALPTSVAALKAVQSPQPKESPTP